jgi:hypothetical protein
MRLQKGGLVAGVWLIAQLGCGRVGYDLLPELRANDEDGGVEGELDGQGDPGLEAEAMEVGSGMPSEGGSSGDASSKDARSEAAGGFLDAHEGAAPDQKSPSTDSQTGPEAAASDGSRDANSVDAAAANDARAPEAGPPADGVTCMTTTYCGVQTPTKVYQNGRCVDHTPNWNGGLPSCGEVNTLCGTNAACNGTGRRCFSTWDCGTCCD